MLILAGAIASVINVLLRFIGHSPRPFLKTKDVKRNKKGVKEQKFKLKTQKYERRVCGIGICKTFLGSVLLANMQISLNCNFTEHAKCVFWPTVSRNSATAALYPLAFPLFTYAG